ncbi:MAG: hypothetical protein BM564_03505 [Bacteroidetes bacterium MedPE-SWsnd-G2]|nr:MAG: hypothetical protein BM564_03505 [Bacteroidetes bacterium MedPE-SWsnd-G2]
MNYKIEDALAILKRTPKVLKQLLSGLPNQWLHSNEGEKTWSPYDVTGHLVHGEKTDWLTRINIILSDSEEKTFQTFDRFAQFNEDQNKPIENLLAQFSELRTENLEQLLHLNITPDQLQLQGIHPQLGPVTLEQLLSTWVAHDLGHIAQITRVMAKQYENEVGPWKAYLGVLNR